MKTILLLTDFSDCASNAIHYAMKFFKHEECKFYVMHVHKAGSFVADDLMTALPNESIYESITKVPKEKLNSLISELKSVYHNEAHSFEIIIDFDVFTDAIKHAIKSNEIDMVVMGSNGATGAIEVVFGSNTINVIRNVSCKTLVVPNGYKFQPITNFLLPLQFDDAIKTEQLDLINSFVKHYDLDLHILRVCGKEETTTNVKYDLERLDNYNCTYCIEEETKFYDAVTNYLSEHDIDMTGLIVHDKGFIKRFFTESPALELSRVIQLPLMIFHTEQTL